MEFNEIAPWLHNTNVVVGHPAAHAYSIPGPPAPKKPKIRGGRFLPISEAKEAIAVQCVVLDRIGVDVSQSILEFLPDLELISFSLLAPIQWGRIAEALLHRRGNYMHQLELHYRTVSCRKCNLMLKSGQHYESSDGSLSEEDFLE